MPNKLKPEPAGRAWESTPLSLLTEWVRRGTESVFATQRILLDLVKRQNANTFNAVRERLAVAGSVPMNALTEMAGEGISNFIAAQRVLLQLAQRQNEIVLGAVKERTPGAPLAAMTDLLRRGIDTFIEMQQHFLTIASKQTDVWIDSAKERKPFDGKHVAELARDAMENFVRSQKKFLDAVAEETAHATGARNGKEEPSKKRTKVAELACEGAEAFIDAEKKLLDIAAQQMSVNMKVARKSIGAINPFPPVSLADLTRHTVDGFVAAQKALLDTMAKRGHARGESELPASATPEPPKAKRKLSAAGREAIIAATKRRWALKRAEAAKVPGPAKKAAAKKAAVKAPPAKAAKRAATKIMAPAAAQTTAETANL